MKTIIPAICTAVILLVSSAITVFILFVILNGYSGTDGGRGLVAFAVWALIMTILFTWLTGFAAKKIAAKMDNSKPWLVGLGATLVSSFGGSVAIGLGIFVGVIVSEISRNLS